MVSRSIGALTKNQSLAGFGDVRTKDNKLSGGTIVGIVVSSLLIFIFILMVLLSWCRKKPKRTSLINTAALKQLLKEFEEPEKESNKKGIAVRAEDLPESSNTNKKSQEENVYGFGVLLLELHKGVKAPGEVDLHRWVESNKELLTDQIAEEEVVQLSQLVADCVSQDSRPTMAEVARRIEDICRHMDDTYLNV